MEVLHILLARYVAIVRGNKAEALYVVKELDDSDIPCLLFGIFILCHSPNNIILCSNYSIVEERDKFAHLVEFTQEDTVFISIIKLGQSEFLSVL